MCARFAALLLVVASAATPARAWNDFGHMAVAYVAYERLTPHTRARVKTLLALNPYAARIWPGMLPPGTSGAEADRMLFMIAATWPDQIKQDGSYNNDGDHNGDRPPADASARENVGYRDHARHKYWHFVDMPFARDGTPLPPVPTPNAGTQIAAFRRTLASRASDRLKSYDLVWLMHLVGDVHQPLHCATRVDAADATGDAGGNKVKVECGSVRCPSNFHAFWDCAAGTVRSLPAIVARAARLPAPSTAAVRITDETRWIAESFQDAQTRVYVAPVDAGDGPFTLTPEYRAAAQRLARERVALGGARLARVLNTELR